MAPQGGKVSNKIWKFSTGFLVFATVALTVDFVARCFIFSKHFPEWKAAKKREYEIAKAKKEAIVAADVDELDHLNLDETLDTDSNSESN